MDRNLKKAKNEVAFNIAVMTIKMAYSDIKLKRLKRMKPYKVNVALMDTETFVDSDWFDTLCLIARLDETKMRVKFKQEINKRYKYFKSKRRVEILNENSKSGWEVIDLYSNC